MKHFINGRGQSNLEINCLFSSFIHTRDHCIWRYYVFKFYIHSSHSSEHFLRRCLKECLEGLP